MAVLDLSAGMKTSLRSVLEVERGFFFEGAKSLPFPNFRKNTVAVPGLTNCHRRCSSHFASKIFRRNEDQNVLSRSTNFHRIPLPVRRRRGASLATATATEAPPTEKKEEEQEELLACPICHCPLVRIGPKGLSWQAIADSGFRCRSCDRAFSAREGYLDLTITGGARRYREPPGIAGVETFRNPLVSFVYERGWRQSFARAGFPGADEEFRMAQEYLQSAHGGVLLDVSCGSGLFARRFAASRDFAAVIASDFSESMLRQAGDLIRDDRQLDKASPVALVRADVARLPFATSSVDAVHAGAALHCWPSPPLAVADISRVLKPGGVFVATTFLAARAPFADDIIKPFRQAIVDRQTRSLVRYWEPEELQDLCAACGLLNFQMVRNRQFIMLAASKGS